MTVGESVIERLQTLGLNRKSPSGRALLGAAELGLIREVRCALEECLLPEELGGRSFFIARWRNPSDWSPAADRYPRLQSDGGPLVPENVRLSHRLCDRVALIEAAGGTDQRDRARSAALKEAALAWPELGKIVVLFTEQARLWRVKFSPQDLRPGASGLLGGHGWRIEYVVREDPRGAFLEYYAANRFVWGDTRTRIYADGDIQMGLATLEPFVVTRPGEDPEDAARRGRKRDERVLSELREAGFFRG
jgi:hypothetical protein